MHADLISLAEQRLHARPTSEAEAKAALERLAQREGKTLEQLVDEAGGAPDGGRGL